LIGVIADDFTGATDVAVAFRREGLRTLLYFGMPRDDHVPVAHDTIVVALKSRMASPEAAVRASLQAMDWLRRHGSHQVYFKYCSTFDSTDEGNIGPVLDALSDALGATTIVTTPSSPEHGRTQYMGYLFVEGTLLSESHMAHHPLTPMTDSSVPRLLSRQTPNLVELVPHPIVRAGPEAIRSAVADASRRGSRYVVIDAIEPSELEDVGRAVIDHPMAAGAAGLARGLATATVYSGVPIVGESVAPAGFAEMLSGNAAVLAGSCSERTLQQIDVLVARGHPTHYLDPIAQPNPEQLAAKALKWYDDMLADGQELAPALHSSAPPSELARVQRALGVTQSAKIVEEAMSRVAVGLVARGVRRLVAAGGETCGAIVSALGVTSGLVGPEAAAGVPWIFVSQRGLALLLKSGNFGSAELLAEAASVRTAEPTPQ
jgi:uncharacterized protein YgbK (DUF1537 family)